MHSSKASIALNLQDGAVVRPSARGVVRGLGYVAVVWALNACASAPPPRPETARPLSPSEEAEAVEAAKRHPIALTYERPREQSALPVPPAPIPAEPPAAVEPPSAQAQGAAEAPTPAPTQAPPPPPRDQVIVVGQDPPSTVTTYTWPETDTDDRYMWVDGGWVERPRYRASVEVWPYAWGGYHGWYQPRPWLAPPPVVVVPGGRTYWHHHHRDAHRHRHVAPGPRYRSAPRRVYVAPPARESRPAVRSSGPTYRAPPARPAPSSRRAVRVR